MSVFHLCGEGAAKAREDAREIPAEKSAHPTSGGGEAGPVRRCEYRSVDRVSLTGAGWVPRLVPGVRFVQDVGEEGGRNSALFIRELVLGLIIGSYSFAYPAGVNGLAMLSHSFECPGGR